MKNTMKLLGIIAMVAIIGFGMAACDNGTTSSSGDGLDKSGTFTATIFSLDTSDYTSVFGTVPASFTILAGTKEELIGKVNNAQTKTSYSPLPEGSGSGLNWNEVEGTVQAKLVGSGMITSANKNTLMNTIGTNGYGIGVISIGADEIGIAAAYRE